MARVNASDPNLYQVTIYSGSGTGGKFGACLVADEQGFSHDGCMDGYTYNLNSQSRLGDGQMTGGVLFICSCKCHETRELTGRES